MNKSLISVIIPCYNQAIFLEETLDSIFNQTYQNWECIIVNDGSTDNTSDLGTKWVNKDSRFIYLENENRGLSNARNSGLDISKGDFIQFLDADDIITNDKIKLSLDCFLKDSTTDIVISNFNLFYKSGQNLLPPYCSLKQELFTFNNVLFKWEQVFTIPIHCGIFKSSLFNDFRFPEELKAKEDWVMWVYVFKIGCKAGFINKSMAHYRLHDESMTKTTNMKQDLLNAYLYLETIISGKEYKELSLNLISRFYDSEIFLKNKLREIKQTTAFRISTQFKKVMRKLGIMKKLKSQ